METMEKPLPTKVKVVKEEPCEITFSVELPKEEVIRETDAVFQQIQSRASLPGFRAGKAPIDLVRRSFADRARQNVLENLVGRAAMQVIRDRKLQTIETPHVEKLEFEFGKALSFQMKVEKDPDIKAKNYKGIKVNKSGVHVTEEKISKALDELRERNSSLAAAPAGAKVASDNFAVIDFDGKINGAAFKGGTAKDFLMDMSAPQTIAGFAEGIVGAAVGDKRSVTVTFPADYGAKEFAGKEAVFDVSVKEIKDKKRPALDDEFAKDLGLASLDELKQKVRENMQKDEEARAEKEVEDQLYQSLLDDNAFPVPPTLVDERAKTLTQRAISNLARQGLVKPGDEQAAKTVYEKSKPQAERDVRLSYLLKAIATQEKLHAEATDVDGLKSKSLAENQDRKADIEKYFHDNAAAIRASLTEGKVLEYLKKNAKIKTPKE